MTAGIATAATPAHAPALKGSTWDITFKWPGYAKGSSEWYFYNNKRAVDEGDGFKLAVTKSGRNLTVVYKDTRTYDCEATYTGTWRPTLNEYKGTMTTDGDSDCIPGTGHWSATESTGSAPAHVSSGAAGRL